MQHRRPRRRLFSLAAVAALLAVGAAACGGGGSSPDSSSGDRTTLRIGDQGKILELQLTLSGQGKGTPYGLGFNTFADGPHMNAAFSANRLDVGYMGDTPVLFANASAAGITAVAVAKSTKNSQTIYAGKDSGIQTLADLKGKKVAVTVGTSLHGYLLQQLDSAGLTEKDVTLVNVPATSLVSTFTSGQVDAVVWVSQYGAALTGTGAQEIKTAPLPQYSVILAAKSALKDPTKRAAIEDFLVRLSRASTWPKAHPDAWVQTYYVQLLKQDPTTSRAFFDSLPATQYAPVTDDFTQFQQKQADLLIGAGQLPKTLKVSDEIDAAFNAELTGKFAAAGLTT
ncbi:ABC transporter substrate-binding protein [Pseudofrankia sp. BMG5.37]|uniref:ABC transporter substrate-binding protein n=1 Tax=Pseudofrankia sp. BMG5.37 TaxID=3050035 RepID=UPI0028940C5E|nr:ABC transporter substrate-binding protein [Pseudofrankia sp. BMG5.37]MDT3440343.1 ABC transporter substrate-binding protein [Pseudofrankia sp. BMG5.37]